MFIKRIATQSFRHFHTSVKLTRPFLNTVSIMATYRRYFGIGVEPLEFDTMKDKLT